MQAIKTSRDALLRKYRRIFGDGNLAKASAWYVASFEDNKMFPKPLLGFGWIMADKNCESMSTKRGCRFGNLDDEIGVSACDVFRTVTYPALSRKLADVIPCASRYFDDKQFAAFSSDI